MRLKKTLDCQNKFRFFKANSLKWLCHFSHIKKPKQKLLKALGVPSQNSKLFRLMLWEEYVKVLHMIISCDQKVMQWIWLNVVIWMCSGWYSNQAYEVWFWLEKEYIKDISISFYIVKHSKWLPCPGHMVKQKQKLLITFNPKCVKSAHSKFNLDRIIYLGVH